ncbi:MAG: protein kinase [Deltaproteobacteria bacterium]|nr:protein kinase [Deltaproteobacteria bacterium]
MGSGAFGTVYLAELVGSRGFRRPVAVKVLAENHPDGEMFVSRVRDEARLLGLLQDEHILKVLELVRVAGRDAVLMEYVEGIDLDALIAKSERPPPRALAELGATVAGALHTAHTARHPSTGEALNVVHRDVKPANVMVTDKGGVRLLDFGVAQARFAARESRTGQFVLGTLNYMAPEYIITGEVSPAADIFGLALTLWEAAAGDVFGQPKLREDVHQKRLDERLGQISGTHAQLVPVLRQMMAWKPQDRPDGATVERQLIAAADLLRGTGLRSWAAAAVPTAMEAARRDARDGAGLVGQAVSIADGDGDGDEAVPSLAGASSAVPQGPPRWQGNAPTLASRSASGSPSPPRGLDPLPQEATMLNVERPAFLDQTSRPAPPPGPVRSVIPAPAPSPRARAAPPPEPSRPVNLVSRPAPPPQKKRSNALWIVVQGLAAGALVGMFLIAVVLVVWFVGGRK